ncbi:MAG: DUF4430 domain-containing protein [Clostridiales bacterium]|nr:DUF4430 domain-containing protein [Clostridiales bacterium]
MKKSKGNAAIIICMVISIVSLMAGLTIIFAEKNNAKKAPDTSTKNIVIEVMAPGYDGKTYKLTTNRQYLGEVLVDEKIAEGENGQYGLYIKSAAGIKADESKSEWWCITKNGEAVATGADAVEIADRDNFELTLKTGY